MIEQKITDLTEAINNLANVLKQSQQGQSQQGQSQQGQSQQGQSQQGQSQQGQSQEGQSQEQPVAKKKTAKKKTDKEVEPAETVETVETVETTDSIKEVKPAETVEAPEGAEVSLQDVIALAKQALAAGERDELLKINQKHGIERITLCPEEKVDALHKDLTTLLNLDEEDTGI